MTKIAVIGGGKMGSALVIGWLESGLLTPEQIVVAEPNTDTALPLKNLGISTFTAISSWITECDIVVVAVKPQVLDAVIRPVASHLENKLAISIAAGLELKTLSDIASGARWVRAMPNQPVTVAMGATGLAADTQVTAEDRTHVSQLFDAVGLSIWVGSESLIHAVTGLSGSGPAFVAMFAEAFEDAGVRAGLPRGVARQLSLQTIAGAALQIKNTDISPSELKDAVTSPGGTTIAGVEALEQQGLRAAVLAGVEAAVQKSIRLGETS